MVLENLLPVGGAVFRALARVRRFRKATVIALLCVTGRFSLGRLACSLLQSHFDKREGKQNA
jgi:hypothetical protein